MITEVQERGFDRKIECSDWRFSAAVVGMVRYFEFHHIRYEIDKDTLWYDSETIGSEADEKYYEFAEDWYREELHHTKVEEYLKKAELTEQEGKELQAKLSANTVMKKIFKDIKYSPEKKEEILERIQQNRQEIVKETYKMMLSGYRKYANPNLMRSEAGSICRLVGYSVDKGRKTRTISYNFDASNFNGKDAMEFDFIPFAFSKGFESIFINNNFTLESLIKTNDIISEEIYSKYGREESRDIRELLFLTLQKGLPFLDYDVEVIFRDRDEEYYKTLMVRKEAVQVFQRLENLEKDREEEKKSYQIFNRPCRLENGNYLPVMKIVCEHINNKLFLDNLIDELLKDGEHRNKNRPESNKWGNTHSNVIYQLIKVNQMIYQGGKEMDNPKMKAAYAAADEVIKSIRGEFLKGGMSKKDAEEKAALKLRSYRQKLISCLVFKNYDRFIEIALQLSSYTQVSMSFLYYLAENFVENKNVAYAFVNHLENYRMIKEGDTADEK
ncbi:type I CRISPR-associated protein Cas8a1/Csx8 [Clostridiales bacterium COT073_COT-073]|nr:type I CRISPR-associated protein Cas8a1/Csx8 [Clostridiales bacterium COT073_COT-073]